MFKWSWQLRERAKKGIGEEGEGGGWVKKERKVSALLEEG